MCVKSEGLERLRRGTAAYDAAAARIATEGPSPDVESELRGSLVTLRSAMNWLEGSNEFEVAHQQLDEAGRTARTVFPNGCNLVHEGSAYFQACPVALAHTRVGLSPGYVVREAVCSVCSQDPEDCSHVKGRTYDGEVCYRIIKRVDVLEVSLVSRPAQPDARIHRISIPSDDLRDSLGDAFTPGVPIRCDRCTTPCDGVRRPFDAT